MANISLKKDYTDGNVLYGKDLNPNFELLETTINANDNAQTEKNTEIDESLTQQETSITQIQSDVSSLESNLGTLNQNIETIQQDLSNLDNDVSNLNTSVTVGDANTLASANNYTNSRLQNYATKQEIPTKFSQLTNDSNYVQDSAYVHTDNNYTDDEKEKLEDLSNYTLPVASSSVLGGIKIGNGLEAESDGTVNVTGGSSGEDGATFTPDVSEEGVISWTNDKGLPNPDPVNIKGPKGDTGATGLQGEPGPANKLSIGTVTTLFPNSTATATITGEAPNQILNLGIPRGAAGQDGQNGQDGQGVPTGGTAGQVLTKNSDTDFDTIWKTVEDGGSVTVIDATGSDEIDLDVYEDEGLYLIKGNNLKQFKNIGYAEYSNCVWYIMTIVQTYGSTGTVWQFVQTCPMINSNSNSMPEISLAYRQISPSLHNEFKRNTMPVVLVSTYKSYEDSAYSKAFSQGGVVDLYNSIKSAIGSRTDDPTSLVSRNTLQTTDKSSLVAAINELKARIDALEGSSE